MTIKIENITKIVANHTILADINFTAKKNQTIAIIGKSGSGKSSLLRILSGIDKEYDGKIFIDELLAKDNPILFDKIGMVFQNFYLFPHFNVLQNLTYAPTICKTISAEAAKNLALELLAKFNLTEKAYTMPNKLSGGQKQRVAIARALMLKPEVLLLDEPTSALNPYSIKSFVKLISELQKEVTIILVTHHIHFAKAVADEIIFIHEGKILANNNKEDFFNNTDSFAVRAFLETML